VSPTGELANWAAHLDAEGAAHSGLYDMDGFLVLFVTFCDPDGVQLEPMAYRA
jgi:glyoxylase I family protein